jgi:hypothetical protein
MTSDLRRARDFRRHAGKYRVVANGRDVSNDCFYFDGRRRIVGLFLRDETGRHYIDKATGGVARQIVKFRRVRAIKKEAQKQ